MPDTRWIRPLLAPLALCLVLSTAASGVVAGERPWVEVRSPHFTVVSDAGDRSARRVAWQFEQVRAVLQKLWPWARVASGKPVVVFAARDEITLKGLVPKFWETKGGMRPASVFVSGRDRHYVALRTDVSEADSLQANPYFQTYWSYVYLVLQSSFDQKLPPWFGRGVSDFFANTIVRDKDVQVGRVVPWHMKDLRDLHLLKLSTVLSVDRQSPYLTKDLDSRIFDASSWALVHYLVFGEAGANIPRFNRFSQLVKTGSETAAALAEVYGDIERLDGAVRMYVDKTMFTYQQIGIDVNVPESGFGMRTLNPAESAADRAALHAAMGRPVEGRALAQEAIHANAALAAPYETEGVLSDAEGKRDEALASFTKAVELGSTNFYAYYRQAQLLWSQDADSATRGRIEKSLERAIELNDESAASYSFLADTKIELDRADDAIGLARRAVTLEPGASYHRATLARALSRTSKQEEALQEAGKALALAKDATERRRAEELIAYLKRVSK
jgi:tetratricopeptide (TPR) repeat protein